MECFYINMESEQFSDYAQEYEQNLIEVFGEDGTNRLLRQIAHDNPSLDNDDVIVHAYSIIPEATAYMLPADQSTLTEAAILVYEDYEAHRRIS